MQVRLLFYEASLLLDESFVFLCIFLTGKRNPKSTFLCTQAHDLAFQTAELRRVLLFKIADVVEVLPDVVVIFYVASEAAADFLDI